MSGPDVRKQKGAMRSIVSQAGAPVATPKASSVDAVLPVPMSASGTATSRVLVSPES